MVRIDINADEPERKQHELGSVEILQYLLGTNEEMETLIMCNGGDEELITTDYNLYEALGSTKPFDEVPLNKLTKFLEVVDVVSYSHTYDEGKPILKEDRVEELRTKALGNKNDRRE